MTRYMTRFLAPAAALMLLSSAAAKAEKANTFVTYDLQWSPFDGSTARATGSITLDTTTLALDGDFEGSPAAVITAFSMTVTGAKNSDDDGTFIRADFNSFTFDPSSGDTVNFNDQLIGQIANFNFATTIDPGAPEDVAPLTLGLTDGEDIVLTSAAPVAAPEPVSLAILGSGLAGLTMLRKRRRSI